MEKKKASRSIITEELAKQADSTAEESAAEAVATDIPESSEASEDAAEASSIDLDELALSVGRAVIEQLMSGCGLDAQSAANMILGENADNSEAGLAALSARAANELIHLQECGKLPGKVEDYIADPNFISLLREMPVSAAVRVYESQKQPSVETSDKAAVEKAEKSLIEKLLARKALPASTKSGSAASPEPDYSGMSSSQFRELSKKLKRAANEGRKVKI